MSIELEETSKTPNFSIGDEDEVNLGASVASIHELDRRLSQLFDQPPLAKMQKTKKSAFICHAKGESQFL